MGTKFTDCWWDFLVFRNIDFVLKKLEYVSTTVWIGHIVNSFNISGLVPQRTLS